MATTEELSKRPKITARLVCSWLFEKDPYVTDEDINRILEGLDLPHDRFVRKDASHYRRLWKGGRLPPAPDDDPRTW